jgi:hypothetical protein
MVEKHIGWHKLNWVVLLLITGLGISLVSGAETIPGSTRYPRLVRLDHNGEPAKGWIVASSMDKIFVSKDDGKTFTHLADVPTKENHRFRCCETLFELPRAIGDLKPGTLLFAATYVDEVATEALTGAPQSPTFPGVFAIDVFASEDHGQHWNYLSTPVSGAGERGAGGLWEPEFLVARNGALVMFWSDETYLCCSQKLMKIRTTDGKTWKDASDVVATTNPIDRSGMIVTRQLPTTMYFMVYEMCGSQHCDVYYRKSRDGWNFALPSNPGTRLEDEEGQFLRHAPAVIWSPSPFSPNGMLVAVGQLLYDANGSLAKQSGRALFVNTHLDGSGPWHRIQAPIQVPDAYDHPCPNYSTGLLPVHNGEALLELATDFSGPGECIASFASKPWSALIPNELIQSFAPVSH